jgi:phosphoenolpyruvate carboxykinase (GTP)
MRVLQWIVERCRGRAQASESAIGLIPAYEDLNWAGAAFDTEQFAELMQMDRAQWERELASHDVLFAKLGAKRPAALQAEREALAQRLMR